MYSLPMVLSPLLNMPAALVLFVFTAPSANLCSSGTEEPEAPQQRSRPLLSKRTVWLAVNFGLCFGTNCFYFSSPSSFFFSVFIKQMLLKRSTRLMPPQGKNKQKTEIIFCADCASGKYISQESDVGKL